MERHPLPCRTRANAPPPRRRDSHYRVYAIVPLVGTGTPLDPKRPMFVPVNGLTTALPAPATVANPIMTRSGILAYHAQITDDGQARDCRMRGHSIV